MKILASTKKGSFVFQSLEQAADYFDCAVFYIAKKIRFGTPILWRGLSVFVDEFEEAE